jgi:tRNA dimethylallyltransferase
MNTSNKLLIICGPTGVGKTSFGLDLAQKYNGELVSADSRQVYIGMDIITGKDLPKRAKIQKSQILWKDRYLGYYLIQGIKVWLNDIVQPDEEFNVSYWNETANLVINDVLSRNKLPIIVGGTGLYIKSLTHNLENISVPPNPELRKDLEKLDANSLFLQLKNINSEKAENLNNSDRNNPRRLIRAIEILDQTKAKTMKANYQILQVGLIAEIKTLENRITQRVEERICNGALQEYKKMIGKYDKHLPSMSGIGYKEWTNWLVDEIKYAKRQITWFNKYPEILWFDVDVPNWKTEAEKVVKNWYTSP